MYIVKFVTIDNPIDEIYYYNNLNDASYHFNLFRDDDSGLYSKIILTDTDDTVYKTINF